jgi:hypothetical protein
VFPQQIQKTETAAMMMIYHRERAVFCGTKTTTNWFKTPTPFLEYAYGMRADVWIGLCYAKSFRQFQGTPCASALQV